MTVTQAEETAEAHHRVGDAAGDFIDHQMIDLSDLLALKVVNVGAFHILAGDQLMVGMGGRGCHWQLPYFVT